jgi:hypothetical protein
MVLVYLWSRAFPAANINFMGVVTLQVPHRLCCHWPAWPALLSRHPTTQGLLCRCWQVRARALYACRICWEHLAACTRFSRSPHTTCGGRLRAENLWLQSFVLTPGETGGTVDCPPALCPVVYCALHCDVWPTCARLWHTACWSWISPCRSAYKCSQPCSAVKAEPRGRQAFYLPLVLLVPYPNPWCPALTLNGGRRLPAAGAAGAVAVLGDERLGELMASPIPNPKFNL